MKVNDIVTVSAKVIAISEAGNPIIQFPCGVKCLIKAKDVCDVRMCGGDTCKWYNTKSCLRPIGNGEYACRYFEED